MTTIHHISLGPFWLPPQNTPDWVPYKQWKFMSSRFAGWEVQGPSTIRWRLSSWFTVSTFLLCPQVEVARELCGVSFTRVLIPSMRVPLLGPKHLPKVPPSNAIFEG